MTTTATNEVIAKDGAPSKKRRSLADKVNQVNQGWDVLNELGDSKFQIPTRKKEVSVTALENNIAAIAKTDAEIIKSYEEQGKSSLNAVQKEIQNIRQNEMLQENSSEVIPVQSPIKNEVSRVEKVDISANHHTIEVKQEAPIATQEVNVNSSSPVVHKANAEDLMVDKNVFFKLVMKGLAQLYVDKTTSLFNPVVFIVKNYRFLLHSTTLLGLPALITWYLFTQVASLKASFSVISTPIYVFYACMFYTAALFLCLTLQVLISGFWSMMKKSMSEVAIKASETSLKVK